MKKMLFVLVLFFASTIVASVKIINNDMSQYPYVNLTYTSTDDHGVTNLKVFHDTTTSLSIKSFSKGVSNLTNNIVLVMDVSGSMSSDRDLNQKQHV